MIYLLIILLIIISICFLTGVLRFLWRNHFNMKWWIFFTMLMTFGVIVGCWAGTSFEYSLNQDTRVIGLPLPLVIFIKEDGNWTDFVNAPLAQYGAATANVIAIASFVLMPLSFAAYFHMRFQKR